MQLIQNIKIKNIKVIVSQDEVSDQNTEENLVW